MKLGKPGLRLSLALIPALLFLACASVPKAPEAGGDACRITLRLATPQEMQNAGGLQTSPYEPPSGLIFKNDTDFVVLVLGVDSARGGERVNLLAVEALPGGAELVSRSDFLDWWKARGSGGSGDQNWTRYVERSYIPEGSFRAHRGKQEYFAVLMGKKPLPAPMNLTADIEVDGEERLLEVTKEK